MVEVHDLRLEPGDGLPQLGNKPSLRLDGLNPRGEAPDLLAEGIDLLTYPLIARAATCRRPRDCTVCNEDPLAGDRYDSTFLPQHIEGLVNSSLGGEVVLLQAAEGPDP